MPKASTLATSSPATVTALRDVLGVQDVLGTVNIFDDTTAGIAATVDGEYFSTPSAEDDEYLILYKNVSEVATEVKRYPSASFFQGFEIDPYGALVASPSGMFSASETGGLYDASVITSLWKDTARTQQVSAAGDAVAVIDDLSGNGNHLTSPLAECFYRVDGNGNPYVEIPASKHMRSANTYTVTVPHYVAVAAAVTGVAATALIFGARSGSAEAFGVEVSSSGYNARTKFISSANGVNPSLGLNTALASLSQTTPTVMESQVSAALHEQAINGGDWWSGTNLATSGFSMANCRIGINISGSGIAGSTNAIKFYGGIIVNRHPTDTERVGIQSWLKGLCGIRALERQAYDIFGIAGQSNGVGQGDLATATPCPWGHGVEYQDGFIKPMVEPTRHYATDATGNTSNTGSAWSAFAAEYYAQTGRRALIVGGCASGVGLTSASQWNTTNAYLSALATKMQDAKAFIEARGGAARIRGVIWVGGENDAVNAVPEATFKAAFIEFYGKVQAAVGWTARLFVVPVDQNTTPGEDVDFAAIRNAQISACADTEGMDMVMSYQGFETAGLLEDTIHWNQTALNTVGQLAAQGVAALLP